MSISHVGEERPSHVQYNEYAVRSRRPLVRRGWSRRSPSSRETRSRRVRGEHSRLVAEPYCRMNVALPYRGMLERTTSAEAESSVPRNPDCEAILHHELRENIGSALFCPGFAVVMGMDDPMVPRIDGGVDWNRDRDGWHRIPRGDARSEQC